MSDTVIELHASEADFEKIGWHDLHIHGMAWVPSTFELFLDIDYILEWLCPVAPSTYFQFRIAPATLVFENAGNVAIALESSQGLVSISEVRRTKLEHGRWHWELECHDGTISFDATGFKLFLRREPVLSDQQQLDLDQRGLPSFARP